MYLCTRANYFKCCFSSFKWNSLINSDRVCDWNSATRYFHKSIKNLAKITICVRGSWTFSGFPHCWGSILLLLIKIALQRLCLFGFITISMWQHLGFQQKEKKSNGILQYLLWGGRVKLLSEQLPSPWKLSPWVFQLCHTSPAFPLIFFSTYSLFFKVRFRRMFLFHFGFFW